jgi:predicted RNA binding protein YcfA (HicA-like mRNA interferase family)
MKLPRNVNGTDAVRSLIRMGFEKQRQKGSHVILRRGGDVAVIPMHRPIAVGTLAAILREANVPLQEFLDNL